MMKTGRNFMIGAAVMAVSVLTPLTSFAATCTGFVPGCTNGNSNAIVSIIGGNQANCPGGKDCTGKACSTADKNNCGKPGCADKNGSCSNNAFKNIASILGQGNSCSR
jgi:hypothetical protein